MKKSYVYKVNGKDIVREINYIPVRYIIAIIITVLEVISIIAVVAALCYFVPYFYVLAWATEICCVIKIISSDDNPEYKIPWLLFVLILPIVGFMLYFIFYSRKLPKKYIKRLGELKGQMYISDDSAILEKLKSESKEAYGQAKMLCNISKSHIFQNTECEYFSVGEDMFSRIIADLRSAERFIFMEYFIIEDGLFWGSILDILKEKVALGVEVRVVYDDIGCMSTLPGNYSKILGEYGIKATAFSRLRGNADSEFNNRSHRKICVIDGKVAYTGGINVADEYINAIERFGHWKDTAIRLEGEAVRGLTELFLFDYGINSKSLPEALHDYYSPVSLYLDAYVIPFGDGPSPIYERRVSKSLIQSMVGTANKSVHITTPYLIIDNDLCTSLENAALRGVSVKLIVPHVPDKKLVFSVTRSFYSRLMAAGVEIYEYAPGFIHAKNYIVDGEYAMIGTVNLDYRSLVHHFENGIWLYRATVISDMEQDFSETLNKSIKVTADIIKTNIFVRIIQSLARIFAPLL